jgi:hypothetical protein
MKWYVYAHVDAVEADVHVHTAVAVTASGAHSPYRWWWFGDKFYQADERLSGEDVKALVTESERKRQKKLQAAHDLMRTVPLAGDGPRRVGIPEDVRRYVFRRDGGRCVLCGSAELLQFDHVMPVALGGNSSAENLQVLCSNFNRVKSASL